MAESIDCNGCKYYDQKEEYCTYISCDGLDCEECYGEQAYTRRFKGNAKLSIGNENSTNEG